MKKVETHIEDKESEKQGIKKNKYKETMIFNKRERMEEMEGREGKGKEKTINEE